MPGILIGLLIWCPAIVGWGVILRRAQGIPWNRSALVLGDIGAGYLALAGVALGANFFAPVAAPASALAALAGWAAAAWAFRRAPLPELVADIRWLAAAAIVIGFAASQPVHYGYDAGLYHLQTMLWTRESAVVPGLANLSSRIGYNSAWLPLATLVADPIDPAPLEHAILLPATVLVFLAPALRLALRAARGGSVAAAMGLLGGLAIASSNLYGTVNSTAHDFVPMLAWILCAVMVVRAFEAPDEAWDRAGDAWRLAALACVVKLSAAPLVLLPAFATAHAMTIGPAAHAGTLRRVAHLVWIPAIVIALWAGRGVVLSGCAAFPAEVTCVRSLEWALPEVEVRGEAAAVMKWARDHFTIEMTDRRWAAIPEWVPRFFGFSDVRVPLALMLAAALIRILARGPPVPVTRGAPAVAGACVIGFGYWLATAPDPRFGAGPMWALGITTAGALAIPRLRHAPRPAIITGASIVALAWLPGALEMMQLFSRPARNPGLGAVIGTHHIRIVETPRMAFVRVESGDSVRVPMSRREDRCYLAPIPCAPTPPERLVIIRDSAGTITRMRRNPPNPGLQR